MTTDVHPSRVLLVEDEFLLNLTLAEALEERGFEVHSVYNARDALEHLTCGAPCDVLLTDINLADSVEALCLQNLPESCARTFRWSMPRARPASSNGSPPCRGRSSSPSPITRISSA